MKNFFEERSDEKRFFHFDEKMDFGIFWAKIDFSQL